MLGVKLEVWHHKIVEIFIDQCNFLLEPYKKMLRSIFGFSHPRMIFFSHTSHFHFDRILYLSELLVWIFEDVSRQDAIPFILILNLFLQLSEFTFEILNVERYQNTLYDFFPIFLIFWFRKKTVLLIRISSQLFHGFIIFRIFFFLVLNL